MRLVDVDRVCKHLHELKTGDKDTVYEYYDDGIDTAISTVAVFPTIEAEPVKHGRWIKDNGLYKCSVCNTFTITGWANCIPIDYMNKTMRYCPNCGARMDLEGENRE